VDGANRGDSLSVPLLKGRPPTLGHGVRPGPTLGHGVTPGPGCDLPWLPAPVRVGPSPHRQ